MDNYIRFKAQRYLYLEMLNTLSEGRPDRFVSFLAMQAQLGWDNKTRKRVEEFLQQEGFIDFPLYGRVEGQGSQCAGAADAVGGLAADGRVLSSHGLSAVPARGRTIVPADLGQQRRASLAARAGLLL